MNDEHATTDLSLRSIEIVDAEGGHQRHLRVFCPVESKSLDPRTCARCDLCDSFPKDIEGESPRLRCRTPRRDEPAGAPAWFVGNEPVSAWLPAGAIAGPALVCARFDAPKGAVGEALERNSVANAVVVDDRMRVLGVVGQAELAPRDTTPVLASVEVEVMQIDEGAPLAEVISRMVYRRAHRIVLVRSDLSAAGLLTEVNVLHWIAVGGSTW